MQKINITPIEIGKALEQSWYPLLAVLHKFWGHKVEPVQLMKGK